MILIFFSERCIIRKATPAFEPDADSHHSDQPAHAQSNSKHLPKSRDEKSLKHTDINQDVAQSHISAASSTVRSNILQAIRNSSSFSQFLAVILVLVTLLTR